MVYMALGLMSGESWIYEWSIGYKGYKWSNEIGFKGMNGCMALGFINGVSWIYKWSIGYEVYECSNEIGYKGINGVSWIVE